MNTKVETDPLEEFDPLNISESDDEDTDSPKENQLKSEINPVINRPSSITNSKRKTSLDVKTSTTERASVSDITKLKPKPIPLTEFLAKNKSYRRKLTLSRNFPKHLLPPRNSNIPIKQPYKPNLPDLKIQTQTLIDKSTTKIYKKKDKLTPKTYKKKNKSTSKIYTKKIFLKNETNLNSKMPITVTKPTSETIVYNCEEWQYPKEDAGIIQALPDKTNQPGNAAEVTSKDKEVNYSSKDNTTEQPTKQIELSHKCKYCEKTFATPQDLLSHLENSHPDQKIFPCGNCPDTGSTKRVFTQHRLRKHTNKIHGSCMCKSCKEKNKTQGENKTLVLNRQELTSNNDITSLNEIIDSATTSEMLHTDLLSAAFLSDNLSISEEVTLATTEELATELNLEHNGDSLLPQQTKERSSATKTTSKEKAHKCQSPFSCNICKDIYKANLAVKKMIHYNPGETYICSFCNLKSSDVKALRLHVLNKHTRPSPYQCNDCQKGFSSKAILKSHIGQNHSHEKRKECKICLTMVDFDLRKHLGKFHSIIIPYQCILCSAIYHYKPNFNEHARQYHPETPPSTCLEETLDY